MVFTPGICLAASSSADTRALGTHKTLDLATVLTVNGMCEATLVCHNCDIGPVAAIVLRTTEPISVR